MGRRYQKLGHITKKKGFQAWEFHFNYGLMQDDIVEVFIIKKPKKRRSTVKAKNVFEEVMKG